MPIPSDPLLASQWHLGNSGGLLDLNVRGVWDPVSGPTYTGFGTRVVVIDNGFDYNHSDLSPNYNTGLDFDFEFNTLDPFGATNESHGTAVAGIIGADDNGTGAVGVAFDTNLVGYRTANFISDAWLQDIRDAIHHAAVSAAGDVANISQGIANDEDSEFGFGYNAARFDEIETSIGTAVGSGRGGLGMTIVKSAGNSRSDNYDVNADDWTNDTRQVVVAAVDQNGFVSFYSSYGAANLVSGFGTPGQVVTTDRVGAAGYDPDDFTETFNGTSAAAPMVSGVVSLIYDANPSLGWRDVQSILALSARHVGSAVGGGIAGSERYPWQWNAADTWNGGGLHFSNDYGYGLVDALAAVRMAETWLTDSNPAQTNSNQFTNTIDMLNAATVIPDGNTTGLTFNGNAIFDDEVDRVTVTVTFSTTWTADLELFVTSPDGNVSELIRDNGGDSDFNGTWTFESQAFRGERAAGNWSVRVVDDAGGDVLTVSDIVLRTFGRFSFNDRYVYTNEYSDYLGVGGHTFDVSDTNGGIDTINAAAVTASSIINLNPGVAGVIDGNFFSVAVGTTIEHAIGGDGNDQLTGNGSNNTLSGNRGNDTLLGESGSDTVSGGYGDDSLRGGFFTDSVNGGEGNDTVTVLEGEFIDNVDGGNGTDTLDLSDIDGTDFSGPVVIDLVAGSWDEVPSFGGPATILGIERILGTQLGDTILSDNTVFRITFVDGQSGNDFIVGDFATDSISGGIGEDTLRGGFNNDVMNGDAGNDVIAVLEGEFIDDVDGGTGLSDTLDLSALTGLGGPGGVSGAAIIDLLAGTWDLTAGSGGGRSIANIESVKGTQLSDSISGAGLAAALLLLGNGGNDSLHGGTGNDTHDGGAGADKAWGRAGNDLYVLDDAGDEINELIAGSSGTDTASSSAISINLTNVGHYKGDIENITLTGGSNLTATGNGLQNLIIGNAGINTLDGGTNADRMRGLGGNDTYRVDNAGDEVNELVAGSSGIDLVTSSNLGIVLANIGQFKGDIENATLLGAANLNLVGNGIHNVLTGNTGINVLDGGLAGDAMRGLGNNDTYRIDDAADVADESVAGSGGTDTAQSANLSLVLASVGMFKGAIENATLTGALNLNTIGNTLGNVLTGNTGNNVLDGGLGADTMNAGNGNDTLRFTSTLGAGNIDRIQNYVVADDLIKVDNADFAGLAAGVLAGTAFFVGAAAHDLDDRIIYNNATGALLFDEDGNNAAIAAVQFALLNNGLAMTAGEFEVI